MYRVLVVDDEEPVLESYEFLLASHAPDFVLAGKARTGYEALECIHELKPDLVFMDINIPGIDGIQIIADVYKKFPSMIFVLSTAYERFDLAQRAIPLGVFAYLVKPVSKKTFLSTIDSVRAALEERNPRRGASPEEAAETAERQFLEERIWEEMSPRDWEPYRELFSCLSGRGIVFLVETEQEQERWCAAVAEKISLRHRCYHAVKLNRGIFFIPEDLRREELLPRLEEVLGETIPPSVFYVYGVGEGHAGPELCLSCREALTALRQRRNQEDAEIRERLRIIQLRRKIGVADPEEVRKIFRSLWREVFSVHDFDLARAKMTGVFLFLMDDCTGCYSGHGEELPPLPAAEEIMSLRDLDQWEAWADRSFEELLRLAGIRRSGKFPLPLMRAIDYIRDHFTERPQLAAAAEAASVSPAYLSRLFSEYLHTSFVDYVTDLRIEYAERLIRKTAMSIKEIAFAAGYQDPNYFGKIFRKATGLPPTMYAAEMRERKEAEKEESP